MPDPQDPATRDRSCLDWTEPQSEPHARVLAWYRRLIALRHQEPDLTDPDLTDTKVAYDEDARWLALRRGDVRVAVNLGKEPAEIPSAPARRRSWPRGNRWRCRARTGCCEYPRSRAWCWRRGDVHARVNVCGLLT